MSMDCNSVRDRLSCMPRAELPAHERSRIIEHLQNCEECNGEYQAYIRAFYLIDQAVTLSPPDHIIDGFAESVLDDINGIKQRQKRSFARMAWPIAATVALGITVFMMFNQSRHEPVSSVSAARSNSVQSTTKAVTVDNAALRSIQIDRSWLMQISGLFDKSRMLPSVKKDVEVAMLINRLYELQLLFADQKKSALINELLQQKSIASPEVAALIVQLQAPGQIDGLITMLKEYSVKQHTISTDQIASALMAITNGGKL